MAVDQIEWSRCPLAEAVSGSSGKVWTRDSLLHVLQHAKGEHPGCGCFGIAEAALLGNKGKDMKQ